MTNRGLHPEAGGPGNVLEVIQGFFLADTKELRNFPQIKRPPVEGLSDLLPYREWFFSEKVTFFFQGFSLFSL